MDMNRRQKRMLQQQGEVDGDGAPIPQQRKPSPTSAPKDRIPPVQFIREVIAELRKVVWPSKAETINYSIVVLITVVVMTLMIYGLDWVFSTFVLDLFEI